MVHVRMCVRVCERELARQGDRGPSIGRRRGREEGEGNGREVPVVKRGNLSPVLCNLLGRGLPRAFIHRRAIQHLAGEKLATAHINTFSPIFLEVLVQQSAQEVTSSIACRLMYIRHTSGSPIPVFPLRGSSRTWHISTDAWHRHHLRNPCPALSRIHD